MSAARTERHGGPAPPKGRRAHPWLKRIAVAAAVAWLAWTAVSGVTRTMGWTTLGRVSDIRAVTYDAEHRLFVVPRSRIPLVLSAISPHRPEIAERLFFCPTGYFVGPHGELFDDDGRYIEGPAARGMDRFRARVEAGILVADLDGAVIGPPRTASGTLPTGPQCRLARQVSDPSVGVLPAP